MTKRLPKALQRNIDVDCGQGYWNKFKLYEVIYVSCVLTWGSCLCHLLSHKRHNLGLLSVSTGAVMSLRHLMILRSAYAAIQILFSSWKPFTFICYHISMICWTVYEKHVTFRRWIWKAAIGKPMLMRETVRRPLLWRPTNFMNLRCFFPWVCVLRNQPFSD